MIRVTNVLLALFFIAAVYWCVGQYQSMQIAQEQYDQSLVTTQRHLKIVEEVNQVKPQLKLFDEWWASYGSSIPESKGFSWLRLSIEESELDFVDYQNLSKGSWVRVKLKIRGTEDDLWNWWNSFQNKYAWVQLESIELVETKKSFHIRNMVLRWKDMDKINLSTSHEQLFQRLKEWKPISKPTAIDERYFKPHSKPIKKSKSSSRKSFIRPNFKFTGTIPGRGVSVQVSGQSSQFWQVGNQVNSWTLISVTNDQVIIRKTSGVQLEFPVE